MYQKRAMSLTEIMVCLFILGIISVPLYYVLSESNKKSTLVMARDGIKQDANKIFAIIENDYTQACKGSFEEKSGTYIIKVRTEGKMGKVNKTDLKYTFTQPTLYREMGGKRWIVSKQVEKFSIDKAIDNAPGKLVLSLTMKADAVGLLDNEQPTYEQNKIIMMMADATDPNDPYWREVEDPSNIFNIHQKLLAGLKEDANLLVKDVTSEISDMVADINTDFQNNINPIGKLNEALQKIKGGITDVKSNIVQTDQKILDLDWEAIYKRNKVFSNSGKRNNAKAIKEKVASLKTLADFDKTPYSTIKNMGKKKDGFREDAIKEMYNAKKELLQVEVDLNEQLKKVENTLKDVQVGGFK